MENVEKKVNENVSAFLAENKAGRLEEIDSLLETIGANNTPLDQIVKENNEENKWKGVYVIEHMPAQYKPSWELLNEDQQNEIVRSSRMYDFTKDGVLVPVTVVEATPNVVMQVKTVESDGYEAVQLGYQDKREVLSNKPEKGHADKAKTSPKRFIREIRGVELKDYEVGSEVTVDTFKEGDVVNVTGTSRGHGYQGNIKRWGQSRGPETHGSRYHRIPGSMGSIINRVPKGKRLPGHMGVKKVTIENLVIEKVVADKNVLMIKGNVPGAKNSLIVVKTASKAVKADK